MYPALHGLLRQVSIAQYQFVRVRAVAAQRMVLHRHGPNALARSRRRPAVLRFLDQFRSLLILILLGAAVLAGK